MNLLKLSAVSLLLTFTLSGGKPPAPSPLTGICDAGGNPIYPNCLSGTVTFTGTDYPNKVRVVATNSHGTVLDDAMYGSSNGFLTFTEDFSFPDTYTVRVKHGQLNDTEIVITTFPPF